MHISNILLAKIGNVLNGFFSHEKKPLPQLEKYTLIKDLTPPYKVQRNRVGLFENNNKQKVIIKRVSYGIKNMEAIYSQNEAFTLKTITKVTSGNSVAPKFIEYFDEPHVVGFASEYFEGGKNIENFNQSTRSDVAIETFSLLKKLSNTLEHGNFYGLAVRKPVMYLLSFPINIAKVLKKKPSQKKKLLSYTLLFYKYYFSVLFGKYSLGLVHRDLYPDNILYSQKLHKIKITDWESAVISDSLYDLAQISMIYYEDIGVEKLISFLNKTLKNSEEKKRFIGLALFNGIQIVGNLKVNDPVSHQTEKFLDVLVTKILPGIVNKKSPFEIINGITLTVIYGINHFFGLPKFSKKKRIILCYHSIGKSGWRFACPTHDFAYQLDYLKKHAKIVSLPKLLEEKTGGVTITFDDGYLDVLENAFPLLEKIHAEATMFALADESHPNRTELDNKLPIMSVDQLKFLHKNGWEIGSHTATHSHLAKISDEQLHREIVDSKKILEDKLGFSLRYFAYPKGIYSKRIIEYVEKAQYDLAFTVDGYAVANNNKDRFEISRISIDGELSRNQFEALLSPLGIFVSGIYMRLLKFKESLHILIDKK